jgi:hypothetical protein
VIQLNVGMKDLPAKATLSPCKPNPKVNGCVDETASCLSVASFVLYTLTAGSADYVFMETRSVSGTITNTSHSSLKSRTLDATFP